MNIQEILLQLYAVNTVICYYYYKGVFTKQSMLNALICMIWLLPKAGHTLVDFLMKIHMKILSILNDLKNVEGTSKLCLLLTIDFGVNLFS